MMSVVRMLYADRHVYATCLIYDVSMVCDVLYDFMCCITCNVIHVCGVLYFVCVLCGTLRDV